MAKSEFVSSFGIASQVFKSLANEVLNLGGSDEDLRKLENDGELRRKVAELIVGVEQTVQAVSEPVVKSVKRVLQFITNITVGAVERFVASEKFVVNTKADARVKIAYLGDNFKKHFLGKIEEGVQAATLAAHTLTRSSLDAPIMAELGEGAETTLAHLYELLSRQPNGEDGVLLINGYANIFYIRDANNVLWAVLASWDSYSDGWRVSANSVEGPSEWGRGCQVFSCKAA